MILLVTLLFNISSKNSGLSSVLCSVLNHKVAMMCLTEKTHVLDKLHSLISYRSVGHEFSVNKSTIYIK